MAQNKKPRKAYRPKGVRINTLGLALHYAAKPAKQDREELLGVLRVAIKALRQGTGAEDDWSVAAGSVGVAQAIERKGIVRGLQMQITAAEQALQTIYDRAMQTGGGQWSRTALWSKEMQALDTFVDIHEFQLDQLGRAEILAALDDARKQIIASGHTATLVHNIDAERMAA